MSNIDYNKSLNTHFNRSAQRSRENYINAHDLTEDEQKDLKALKEEREKALDDLKQELIETRDERLEEEYNRLKAEQEPRPGEKPLLKKDLRMQSQANLLANDKTKLLETGQTYKEREDALLEKVREDGRGPDWEYKEEQDQEQTQNHDHDYDRR